MRKRTALVLVCVAGLVGALTATAVAQSQRFSDVPPDHYAFEAAEWAAEVGITVGYPDGTFKPERSLSKRHAVVFMERYYDEVLEAEESDDFTRGDMMVLLKAIDDGTTRQPEPSPDSDVVDSGSGFTDPYSQSMPIPVAPSIHEVQLLPSWTEFRWQSIASHSDRDVTKWTVYGWLQILCSTHREQPEGAWFVVVTINGGASLPEHFEGLNVRFDDGPLLGMPTMVHGHIQNRNWGASGEVAAQFVSRLAASDRVEITTRYYGEGLTFDVSELRLFSEHISDRCKW